MSKTSARVLGRFAQHLLLSNFFLFRSADLKKAEAKEVYSSSEDEVKCLTKKGDGAKKTSPFASKDTSPEAKGSQPSPSPAKKKKKIGASPNENKRPEQETVDMTLDAR